MRLFYMLQLPMKQDAMYSRFCCKLHRSQWVINLANKSECKEDRKEDESTIRSSLRVKKTHLISVNKENVRKKGMERRLTLQPAVLGLTSSCSRRSSMRHKPKYKTVILHKCLILWFCLDILSDVVYQLQQVTVQPLVDRKY
uniref:Uncharacterized protein n=1 Tax=Arion vulgaris TaxID=1028688 RepID=A0A0B7AUW4_9EUPU